MSVLSDPSTLEKELLAILTERILPEGVSVDLDTALQSAGLDSLATMQLLLQIENTYGISLPDADISCKNLGSIRTIAQLMKRYEAAS